MVNVIDLVQNMVFEPPIRNYDWWIILLEKHDTVSSMVRSGVAPSEISLSAQQAAVPLPKPQNHVIQPDQRKIRETPLEFMIKHVRY